MSLTSRHFFEKTASLDKNVRKGGDFSRQNTQYMSLFRLGETWTYCGLICIMQPPWVRRQLTDARSIFLGRLVGQDSLFMVTRIDVIPVSTYYFIEFYGVDGLNASGGYPIRSKSFFYLLNSTCPIWRLSDVDADEDVEDVYLGQLRAERFPAVAVSLYEIPHAAFDATDTRSCIQFNVDWSRNVASMDAIGNKPSCGLPNLDTMFYLRFKCLSDVGFDGPVYITDMAVKAGRRMALYVMEKYDDNTRFSKYQDYGFQIQPDRVADLVAVKAHIRRGLRPNRTLLARLDYGLSMMVNPAFRETLATLAERLNQVGGRRRRTRRRRR